MIFFLILLLFMCLPAFIELCSSSFPPCILYYFLFLYRKSDVPTITFPSKYIVSERQLLYFFWRVIRGKRHNYGVVLHYGVNGPAEPKYSKYGVSQIALEDLHPFFAAGRVVSGASWVPWRARKLFAQI